MAPTLDRISNLPKNITKAILMQLPLRDAVRTSILSRYWRYKWNKLPELVFDENCIPYPYSKTHKMYDKKIMEIVNQVLFLHRGPIRKFTLKVKLERGGVIDRYILYLSRNGIEEFSFETMDGDYYEVPSCLFLCEELTYLWLCGCTINIPDSFIGLGFSWLTTLTLHHVNIHNQDLQSLIPICPRLKKLDLEYIGYSNYLNIVAWKLVEARIDVEFEDVYFENSPLLAILSINLRISEDRVVSDRASGKLAQVLGRQPRIERLELSGRTLQIYSDGDVPSMLPTARRLKYLSIDLNFEDRQQMLAARCIFRSSPFLQELRIKASSSENSAKISIEGFWDCSFSRLQTVEVTNFSWTDSEVKFVEFVLASAPVLEKFQIRLEQEVPDEEEEPDALHILKKMNSFLRVSAKAQLVFPE